MLPFRRLEVEKGVGNDLAPVEIAVMKITAAKPRRNTTPVTDQVRDDLWDEEAAAQQEAAATWAQGRKVFDYDPHHMSFEGRDEADADTSRRLQDLNELLDPPPNRQDIPDLSTVSDEFEYLPPYKVKRQRPKPVVEEKPEFKVEDFFPTNRPEQPRVKAPANQVPTQEEGEFWPGSTEGLKL